MRGKREMSGKSAGGQMMFSGAKPQDRKSISDERAGKNRRTGRAGVSRTTTAAGHRSRTLKREWLDDPRKASEQPPIEPSGE
jgi:hypothetical protein